MDELKTLKDYDMIQCLELADIKQEAIKWVRLFNEEVKDIRPHNLDNYHEKLTGLTATSEWVKMFFNITDEELN